MLRFIVINTRFAGLHRWPAGTPDFLQQPHRHEFTVRVELEVAHNDRELEIITVEAAIQQFIKDQWMTTKYQALGTWLSWLDTSSCEDIAEQIGGFLEQTYKPQPSHHRSRFWRVEVLEDGVLGARLESGTNI